MTLTRHARLERTTRLKSSRGPIDKKARARRRRGGKLAVGRDSGTRDSLTVEREYVKGRTLGLCEVGNQGSPCGDDGRAPFIRWGTDFAHVVARSAGGEDTRFNALWLCRYHHRMMERPYAKGRLVVTRVTKSGVRGFDWEIVKAAGKVAYRLGAIDEIVANDFIAAEKP